MSKPAPAEGRPEKLDETIISVARSFEVIEMLADSVDGMPLAEISRQLELNKAIVTKIMHTLENLGLVWRDERAQRYYLTYRVSNLGLRHLQTSRLLDQCSAALRQLAEETGELVRLAIVEPGGQRIVWVQSFAGSKRSLRIDPNYSLQIGLHTHATGKAWLSTLPFAEALQLLLQQGLNPLTPHSKTSVAEIRSELEEAARRGFALSYEENELGVGAVAAPIRASTLGGAPECVGVVSLAAPSNRMSRSDLESYGLIVVATTTRLGETWPLEARARSGAFPRRVD
ncbi:IclR family transcriptional regulator [Aquabacter cavernae]|uniref:IclR family transcriptional regulator n=1 Tax=Aquabacter cavernae TaxID=2496029 RepID=UPI000F8DCB40|nr:IclR family transcriptional regulator [Aquabacter cavernae]